MRISNQLRVERHAPHEQRHVSRRVKSGKSPISGNSDAVHLKEATAANSNIIDSIAMVLSAKRKERITPENLTGNSRVNEEELYAAALHHRLSEIRPDLSDKLADALPGGIAKSVEIHGRPRVFNAADRIMRSYVRSGELTHKEYRELRRYAFGKAQLDGDKTRVSDKRTESSGKNSAVRSLKNALSLYDSNSEAAVSDIKAYRKRMRELSRAKRSSGSGATAAGAGNTSAPGGFLWKPESDNGGNLVILLPSSYVGKAVGVKILSPSGEKVLERGSYSGVANGFRQHFRFKRPGGSYPPGSIVEIEFRGGESQRITIPQTGARVEG